MKYKALIVIFIIFQTLSLTARAEEKFASIVVDASSGTVIQATAAEKLRYPASLTKIMTLYMTFKALRQGSLRINQALPVSEYAASMPPSKLGLRPYTSIRVRDAIFGLVTESANDAAVVLAEALAGSEGNFAYKMTDQARKLGMKRTVFRNASGLPNDDQMTTARDMAILARAVYFNFPEYYRFFSTASFTYLGRTHKNHNKLMQRYAGMDGLKTGYIRASGFNLVASAVRHKTRLIAVVFGGESAAERDRTMAALLDSSFIQRAKRQITNESVPDSMVQKDQPDERVAEGDTDKDVASPKLKRNDVQNIKQQTLPKSQPAAGHKTAIGTPAGITLALPNPVATTKAAPAPEFKTAPAPTWRVELAPFTQKSSAQAALKRARGRLPANKRQSTSGQVIAKSTKGKKIYIPQLTNLDNVTAKQLCRTLGPKTTCRVLPVRL